MPRYFPSLLVWTCPDESPRTYAYTPWTYSIHPGPTPELVSMETHSRPSSLQEDKFKRFLLSSPGLSHTPLPKSALHDLCYQDRGYDWADNDINWYHQCRMNGNGCNLVYGYLHTLIGINEFQGRATHYLRNPKAVYHRKNQLQGGT